MKSQKLVSVLWAAVVIFMTPGIAGALAGGILGAAAIDPRVLRHLG